MMATLKEIQEILEFIDNNYIYILDKDSSNIIYEGEIFPSEFENLVCNSYDYTCAGDLILFV